MRFGSMEMYYYIDSLAHNIYGQTAISERHRHHYELQQVLMLQHLKAGLKKHR
jgi:CTP synthase (UTP-ammonia lyase)